MSELEKRNIEEDSEITDLAEAMDVVSRKSPELQQTIMAMMGGGNFNPIHSKLNEGHIHKLLDLAVVHDEREYNITKDSQKSNSDDRKFSKQLLVASIAGVMVFILIVLWLFKDQPDVLIPIMTGLGGLLGGGLGGFGIGTARK